MFSTRFIRLTNALKVSLRSHSNSVAPSNPGPPTTLDYMPIPHKMMPFAKVHSELQAKFNIMMGIGLTMLTASLICAVKANVFHTECTRAPTSWYERK